MKRTTFTAAFQRAYFILFYIIILYFGFLLVQYNYSLVVYPYPLEYREGSMLLTTNFLLQGKNPYALENMPVSLNVYGINYNLLVYPFAKAFGASFFIHRLIAAVCMMLIGLLFYATLRKHNIIRPYILSSILILYASLLYYITPLARPDTLGTLLFLSSVFVLYLLEYSNASMFASICLGLVAFYTKSYFALSIPLMAIYLFLFVSKQKGLIYGVVAFVLLVMSALVVNYLCELYFLSVIVLHLNIINSSYQWLWKQIVFFWDANSGLIILGVLLIFAFLADRIYSVMQYRTDGKISWPKLKGFVNILDLHRPLFKSAISLSLYCLIATSLAIYFKMGRHGGNWMAYFYQLITPFLTLYIFSLTVKPLQNPTWSAVKDNYGYLLIIPLSCLTLFHLSYSLPLNSNQKTPHEWAQLEEITLSRKEIFNSPILVSMLVEQNKPVYDSGQSEYFTSLKHHLAWLDGWFPTNSQIKDAQNKYKEFIEDSIISRKFEVLIIDDGDQAPYLQDMENFYSLDEKILVCMFHTEQCYTLDVWRPK